MERQVPSKPATSPQLSTRYGVPGPPMGGPPMGVMFPGPMGGQYAPPGAYGNPNQFGGPPPPQPGFGGIPPGGHFGGPPQQPPPWQQGGQGGNYGYQQGMAPLGPGAPIGPGGPYPGHSGGPGFGYAEDGQFDSPPQMFGGGPGGYPGRPYS